MIGVYCIRPIHMALSVAEHLLAKEVVYQVMMDKFMEGIGEPNLLSE